MAASREQIQAFQGLLGINDIPDFTIKIGFYKWRIHSQLFSKQSKFFQKLCQGSFKEAQAKEVTLHDDCPWIIGRMIQFCYLAYYVREHPGPNPPASNTELRRKVRTLHASPPENLRDSASNIVKIMEVGTSDPGYDALRLIDAQRTALAINVLLYQLAEKYEILGLRRVTMDELKKEDYQTSKEFFAVVDVIGMNVLHREPDLLQAITKSISHSFIAKPNHHPRIKRLIEADGKFALMMIESLHHDSISCHCL